MSDQEKRVDGPELVPNVVQDLKLAEFELQLARAMRRVDAPEGFAARVMERAASPKRVVAAPAQVSEARPFDKLRAGSGAPGVVVIPKRSGLWRMQAWAGGAIAAVLVLGMFGAEQLHLRHERAEQTAMANQQFAVAMQVTDHALAQTREQLARAGLNLGE
jgi:hypothetical protein